MTRNPDWSRDELILALDLYFRIDWAPASPNHPEIIALSNLLKKLPIHEESVKDSNFRNPNGVYMKLSNLLRLDPTYEGKGLSAGSRLDVEVWNEFSGDIERLQRTAKAIRENFQYLPLITDSDEDIEQDEVFIEGHILTRTHKRKERSAKAVTKKKEAVLKETGALRCEVCGFDFNAFYGELGYGFAECHHLTPLEQLSGGSETRLSDLAIVCSNCHQMLHRCKSLPTIEELQQIIWENQA